LRYYDGHAGRFALFTFTRHRVQTLFRPWMNEQLIGRLDQSGSL
jgi:hypothetical protein